MFGRFHLFDSNRGRKMHFRVGFRLVTSRQKHGYQSHRKKYKKILHIPVKLKVRCHTAPSTTPVQEHLRNKKTFRGNIRPSPRPFSAGIRSKQAKAGLLTRFRRDAFPTRSQWRKNVAATNPKNIRNETHSSGNCCRLTLHSLLIPAAVPRGNRLQGKGSYFRQNSKFIGMKHPPLRRTNVKFSTRGYGL